jgi:hypothetical protein
VRRGSGSNGAGTTRQREGALRRQRPVERERGVDVGGVNPLGNAGSGVLFSAATDNLVNGKNVIEFKGGAGVKVDGTAGTTNGDQIISNQIDLNHGLGIALVGGGNDGQAAPTITGVTSDGTTMTVKATLTSTPSTPVLVQLFAGPACDPSGSGEGRTLDAAKTVTTDGAGNATFSLLTAALPSGQVLTATATRQTSIPDSSAFSTCATTP